MNERDFLILAAKLARGTTEADWRTAVGRAYYAGFHVARRLLEDLGFAVPRADRAHAYLAMRLQNCGDPSVGQAGGDLNSLRQVRNQADYDLHRLFTASISDARVRMAEQIIRALDAARAGPTRSQITGAMRIYERDVLRDVTWQGP
jgi:uncharacterized protein (UPF0332 family)